LPTRVILSPKRNTTGCQRALGAVFAQRTLNRRLHALVDARSPAQIALSLLGHAALQMAGAGLTVFGVALGSQSESFLGTFVCLLLWHCGSSTYSRLLKVGENV